MNRISVWALPVLLVLVTGAGTVVGADAPGYKLTKTIKIGGEGGWDYLTFDHQSNLLYISRSTRVQIVDVEKEKVVAEIANTPGVHGIALVHKHKRGFTSNGRENTVTVFDLETRKEMARPKVGENPDAILYDPFSDRVFTFNGRSHDATALDAASSEVVGTVKLGGKPESAVSDHKGTIYVNIEDKSEVVAFDAKELKEKNRWPVAPGKAAVGLAMDREKKRLFVSCQNEKMVVLDADSGKVVGDVAIGKRTDFCVFDQEAKFAFSSNGDGTLTVVGEGPDGAYHVAETVKTQPGARTCALDSKTHTVYLVTAKFKPAAGGGRPMPEPDSFVLLVVSK
jgi:DNA-binding beta-propeller fold protein YncE